MTTDPRVVQGAWRLGWTLDRHTTRSVFIGYDENGHERYETTRSPIGELIFQLKYRRKRTAPQIADVISRFFDDKPVALGRIEAIVPMPASEPRAVQPVLEVAKALGRKLRKPVLADVVTKVRKTPGLKDVRDPEERRELLDGAFKAEQTQMNGKSVLLIDDLYRSGATANAVTLALLAAGARRVYFLAATRTRSNA